VCNDSKNELMQEIGDVRVLTMKKKIQSIKRSLDIFSKLSFFVVLGFEFRAYTLSHSTSPFFMIFFFQIGSLKQFAQLSWNYNLPGSLPRSS
jgi:hypothetical protein